MGKVCPPEQGVSDCPHWAKGRASRRGGQDHFSFLCEEKRNGPGLQREKMGLIIVGLSLSPSAARKDWIARGRRRHWAARRRTGNKVVLLLQPPRPPLGYRIGRSFPFPSPFAAQPSTTQPSHFHLRTTELFRFCCSTRIKTNSPSLQRRESFCLVETIKGEGSNFQTLDFNDGHGDRTRPRSSRLSVLCPRGGRGGTNRNATHRQRITSRRPVAASSTTNPVIPGRRG